MSQNSTETGRTQAVATFPKHWQEEKHDNPAIALYGRRFYKDQTLVEYLAELLLVFASGKGLEAPGGDQYTFTLSDDEKPLYWPWDRLALKLFAFFPTSKLDTRHPVHQIAYTKAISLVADTISGSHQTEREDIVRLVQSLFAGFVGVANDRTWVTHAFLPASTMLLGRELNWSHSKALRNPHINTWKETREFFETDRHIFMARGGELLFLQLANLFHLVQDTPTNGIISAFGYDHLSKINCSTLKTQIESGLQTILTKALGPIELLANFVEKTLGDYALDDTYSPTPQKHAILGWAPVESTPEALLFAYEINNICQARLGALEKLDLLKILCGFHVLRSLCFQASRCSPSPLSIEGFVGGYCWIATSPDTKSGEATYKLAQNSFDATELLLYRVLRNAESGKESTEADKHGYQIFRKLAKELGFVVPRTGVGQRFVLPPRLLRFLVAALLAPGESTRLDTFFSRVFAHYGLALGSRQIRLALQTQHSASPDDDSASGVDIAWLEEALKQGGYLVELSDAVSIVQSQG